MKFKKFMALGLVAAMTATLFAGCGSKGNDSADQTLYWEKQEKT